MTGRESAPKASSGEVLSDHEILLRLDLATEVLEGLDELGLESRTQVEELLARLEAQVADMS
jgi:hypothetical protein